MGLGSLGISAGTQFAESVASGLGGLAVDGIAGLFGNSSKDAEKRQHQYELEKMEKQAEYNKEAATYSQELAKDMWQYTGYENTVQQIKNAGLNVGLIYGQGGTQGQSTSGGRQEGVSQGISQAVGMGLQLKQIQAQTNLANAEAAKANAEAKKIGGADTEFTESQTKLNDTLEKLKSVSIDALKVDMEKTRKDIEYTTEALRGLINDNDIKIETKEIEINKAGAEYNKLVFEGIAAQAKAKLDEKEADRLQKVIDNFEFELSLKQIHANAAKKSADAAMVSAVAHETSAGAAQRQAGAAETAQENYKEYLGYLQSRLEKEGALWNKLKDKWDSEITQGWVNTTINGLATVVDGLVKVRTAGLVSAFKDKKGKDPTKEEMADIEKQARMEAWDEAWRNRYGDDYKSTKEYENWMKAHYGENWREKKFD